MIYLDNKHDNVIIYMQYMWPIIDILRSQYEIFFMIEYESINDMINKFPKITNNLASLGDEIDNDQKMRKVSCALPPS